MSWLARSFANSLAIDEEDPHQKHRNIYHYSKSSVSDGLDRQFPPHEEQDQDQSHGVITETLTRPFLGVAHFIAPPRNYPDQEAAVSDFDPSELYTDYHRNRAGPENFQVDTISPQLGSASEEPDCFDKADGLTDEVLSFAANIAHHPETWLDFPIDEEDDLHDFDLSDSQKEHAVAVESLTPRLRALRIELCPAHMSICYFWMVYFVLLHSRLNKHDAELLSTSHVVEARAQWMHELQKRTKEELERQRYHKENAYLNDDFGPSSPSFLQPDKFSMWTFAYDPASSSLPCDPDTKKQSVTSAETEFIDKSVISEKPVIKSAVEKHIMGYEDDDDDDWPEDDLSEDGKGVSAIPLGIEEEVSFSDLEDDDCSIHAKYDMQIR